MSFFVSYFIFLTTSYSSVISFEGAGVIRLNIMIARQDTMKAGRSSYISQTPPKGLTRYFQMNTIAPPDIIPAMAPYLFERLQKRANSTTGPKAAPNPAHANETIPNTELSGFLARKAAIIAITRSVALAKDCFLRVCLYLSNAENVL